MITLLLAIAFGFGCGVLLTLFVVYKFIRYGLKGIAALLAGIWATIGGGAGVIGRILNGFVFGGIISWHLVFDLNKNQWLDIQFLDEAALWLAKLIWPSIRTNIENYPIGIGAFFVWGASSIGLDVSGLDPRKYPSAASAAAATATPPPPAPLA